MKNFTSLVLPFFLLLSFLSNQLIAQINLGTSATITAEKKRLLILPTQKTDSDPFSIENEVTQAVAGVATRLKRFEIIDRNNLENILDEQSLRMSGLINDSTILQFGKLAACDEALIISVHNFYQKGVPPEENEDEDDNDNDLGFWGGLLVSIFSDEEEVDEPFADNIQTQLSVEIKKIDIKTGESLHSFDISTAYTGGTRGVSRGQAIKNLKKLTTEELKKLYVLSSQVISVKGSEALLFLGSEVGVNKNTLFQITQPDRKKTINDRKITIPGRLVGFVCVEDYSRESNRSQVIRQWSPIKEGYTALEYSESIHGLQVYISPKYPEKYFHFGLQYHVSPIAGYDYGFSLCFTQATDSYKEKDNGFGIGGFFSKRVLISSPLQVNARIGLNADILFRDDDENHSVTSAVISAPVGLNISYLLSANSDIEINFGYRFAGHTPWQYSAGEESKDAIWIQSEPEIDISGMFFTVGYKFILL